MRIENADVPAENEDAEQGRAPKLRRELRQWVIAILVAAPILAAEWLFLRVVPAPWNLVIPSVTFLALLIAFGVFSKSNIWQFLVWLGPLVVMQVLWLAGLRNPVTSAGLVLAAVWAGGIMLYEPFGTWAFNLVKPAYGWLSTRGLPAEKRRAYRELSQAMRLSLRQRQDQLQRDDLSTTVRALRETAVRIEQLSPPDEAWAKLYAAFAAPSAVYADMLEGKRELDYDEARALLDQRQLILDEVLRGESRSYRILNYVPFA